MHFGKEHLGDRPNFLFGEALLGAGPPEGIEKIQRPLPRN
jgi:hypothetical protein